MEDEIVHASAALADALGRHDVAGAGRLYADDAILLSPAAELISGRSDIEAYWGAGLALGLARIELTALELRVVADTAIEVGRYVLGLESASDGGKYCALHRRDDGGAWRRVVDVFNPDAQEER
jgi:ketosteroid isomerase-like protein